MAAAQTVPQFANPTIYWFRHGVVTLYGYGVQVRVDRGHLVLEDGIGVMRSSDPTAPCWSRTSPLGCYWCRWVRFARGFALAGRSKISIRYAGS